MLDYSAQTRCIPAVKTEEAIKFFGSKAKLARALGVTKQAVSRWGEYVPHGRAFQLQVITNGALKTESEVAA